MVAVWSPRHCVMGPVAVKLCTTGSQSSAVCASVSLPCARPVISTRPFFSCVAGRPQRMHVMRAGRLVAHSPQHSQAADVPRALSLRLRPPHNSAVPFDRTTAAMPTPPTTAPLLAPVSAMQGVKPMTKPSQLLRMTVPRRGAMEPLQTTHDLSC